MFDRLLLVVLLIGALAWGYVEHRKAVDYDYHKRREAVLQEENGRLREALTAQEKKSSQATEEEFRKPIEEAVSRIRGLPFKEPVVYDVLTRAGIKKVIEGKLAETYSDEDFKNVADGLAALGLLPPDYPLKQKYVDLLGEQVAAFYDQHQHKLFMFEDASLKNSQNRVILAHELTHALQDQNFGLLRMPLEIKTDDDLALAASALIEGDATAVMSDYMMENMKLNSLGDSFSGMFSQSMDQVQSAPRYLREMLIFPYIRGQQFCAALRARGGYQAVSDAFKNPPKSSSQILHPEKYFNHEDPIMINWPDTTAMGQKPIADNVVGEMGIRILLGDRGEGGPAAAAAAGWCGDRFLVYRDPAGTELVWKTTLDNAEDARRFLAAIEAKWTKRYGLKEWTPKGDATFLNQKTNGVLELSCADGRSVVLIDATSNAWAEALAKKFLTDGQN